MFFSECPCELYNRLHPFDLSLDIWVKVFFPNGGEIQEMDGAIIASTWRQEFS
jgi:hypothetical protein